MTSSSTQSDYIELLTEDDDGRAIEGAKYSVDVGVVRYRTDAPERLAYPHKFFKRDKCGQPVPETLVRFLVPDYLCVGAVPSRRALELVEERDGMAMMAPQHLGRSERDRRIAEIGDELAPLHERVRALAQERAELIAANDREDWPAGPFTLHYWQQRAQEGDEYDTPLGAVRAAIGLEDYGNGSAEKITDRAGRVIYDLSGPGHWKRVADEYPDLPEDAY